MGILRSITKSSRLRKISKRLDQDIMQSLGKGSGGLGLQDALSARKAAEEDLLDLVESDPDLLLIMQKYSAKRNTLNEAYDGLCQVCGLWTKGHFVPASTLAFGPTLDYVLAKIMEYEQIEGPISREDGKHSFRRPGGTSSTLQHPALPYDVGIRLTRYFESNETGAISD